MLEQRLKKFGYEKTTASIKDHLPQTQRARSGGLGEIRPTEYVNRNLKVEMPYRRPQHSPPAAQILITAIRLTRLCEEPVAVMCSMRDRVHFACMSKPLQGFRDLTRIRKGSGVPGGLPRRIFDKDENNVARRKRVVSTFTLDSWYDSGGDAELTEEVVGLGNYGRTLTVLRTCLLEMEDAEERQQEREDDENLLPSQRWRWSA